MEVWSAVAACASAVAAIAALAIGHMSLMQSRAAALESRMRTAHETESALQSRLDPMYPGLRAVLGGIEDGIPLQIRQVVVPLYVLFADAYAAHRDGLLTERHWDGMRSELAHMVQKPIAVRAWQHLKQQVWTEGFAEFIDEIHAGPRAYPELAHVRLSEPTIVWEAEEPDVSSSPVIA